MNEVRNFVLTILSFVVLVGVYSSTFVVEETEQYIITQLGKPVRKPITHAGLYFKIPFLENAIGLDKRVLEWDGHPNQIPTRDKKYIMVDTTARWKIVDPLKFIQTVRTETGAQSRLDDIIDSATREAISRHNLNEVVRNSNRIIEERAKEIEEQKLIAGSRLSLDDVKVGREKIEHMMLTSARPTIEEYGIELIDVKIKRLNYEESVQKKVFDRMISERKQIAEKLRSEGHGKKEEIEGRLEKELKEIRSEAYKTSQHLKGAAEAEAASIYADAFNKDPAFYSYSETLKAYEESLDKKVILFLSSDGEFLEALNK